MFGINCLLVRFHEFLFNLRQAATFSVGKQSEFDPHSQFLLTCNNVWSPPSALDEADVGILIVPGFLFFDNTALLFFKKYMLIKE